MKSWSSTESSAQKIWRNQVRQIIFGAWFFGLFFLYHPIFFKESILVPLIFSFSTKKAKNCGSCGACDIRSLSLGEVCWCRGKTHCSSRVLSRSIVTFYGACIEESRSIVLIVEEPMEILWWTFYSPFKVRQIDFWRNRGREAVIFFRILFCAASLYLYILVEEWKEEQLFCWVKKIGNGFQKADPASHSFAIWKTSYPTRNLCPATAFLSLGKQLHFFSWIWQLNS